MKVVIYLKIWFIAIQTFHKTAVLKEIRKLKKLTRRINFRIGMSIVGCLWSKRLFPWCLSYASQYIVQRRKRFSGIPSPSLNSCSNLMYSESSLLILSLWVRTPKIGITENNISCYIFLGASYCKMLQLTCL